MRHLEIITDLMRTVDALKDYGYPTHDAIDIAFKEVFGPEPTRPQNIPQKNITQDFS